MQPIEAWLSKYINTLDFATRLEDDIDRLDKPSDRVRIRLELLSYLVPKVKTVDPLPSGADQAINVIFQLDNGGPNEQDGTPIPVPAEVLAEQD
jgi:hypothetical protein